VRAAEAIIAVASTCLLAGSAGAAETVRFNTPAGGLTDALIALGEQARITLVASEPGLAALRAPALHGRMTVAKALQRLLSGSGYGYVMTGTHAVRIVRSPRQHRHMAWQPPPPARHNSPAPAALEEDIIVTGSKRRTALSDFAGTAHVLPLGAADVSRIGARGTDAIVEQIPMLAATSLGPGRNKLYIRGIADSSFNGPSQSIIGQYLGDVRLTFNAPDPDLRLYDMKSVELLEGPQGTLYGSGSLGGILRLVPNAPDVEQFEGSGSAGLAATRHGGVGSDGAAMLNVPIEAGRIALRVVGYGSIEPGYIDDVQRGLKDVNRTTIKGGRATLLADVGNGWQAEVGGLAQYISDRDGQYALRGLGLARRSSIAQPFDNDYVIGEATVRKRWADAELISATSLVRHTLESQFDATGYPGTDGPQLFTEDINITLISNETRISSVPADGSGWVIGSSLLHDINRLSRSLGPPALPIMITGVHNETTEAALFGQYEVPLSRRLVVTLGGRLTYQKAGGGLLDGGEESKDLKRTDFRASPTAALTWRLGRGVLFYSRYQQGFRAGGLAVGSGASGAVAQRFHSDELSSIEAGVRLGRLGVSRVAINLAMSYARWSDIQADLIDARGLPYTTNLGDGRIYSIEAEASWHATPALRFELAAYFNDSALSSPAPAFAAADERDLPNISKTGARLAGRYNLALSSGVALAVDGTIRYVGKSQLGVGAPVDIPQGKYIEAQLGARLDLGRWGVSLDVTNVADAEGNRFSFGNPFTVGERMQVTPLQPRTIRIGLDTEF
jgi:iron complex outermembrane receptor protein